MPIQGLLVPGNIDLYARPEVQNPDGTTSTVRSMSFENDGRHILVPTVVGNRVVSPDEAIRYFRKTGQHLGIFATAEDATRYATQLHNDYAAGKYKRPVPLASSHPQTTLSPADIIRLLQQSVEQYK